MKELGKVSVHPILREGGKRVIKDCNGNPVLVGGKKLTFSKLDLRSLLAFSDEEIYDIIEKDLGIDLDTEEGMIILNVYFRLAIEKIEDTPLEQLFKNKKVDFNQIPKKIHTKEELLKFVKNAGKDINDPTSNLMCIISKITSSVAEILQYDHTHDLDTAKNEIVEFLKKYTNLKEIGGKLVGKIGGKDIILHRRTKSTSSMTDKNMGQIDYSSIDTISDREGFTFEISGNNIDAFEVMYEIDQIITGLGGIRKEIITKDLNFEKAKSDPRVKNNKKLSELLDSVSFRKKNGTSKNYSEFVRTTYLFKNLSIECKFVGHGNANQDGINFSGVYAYLQKYIEGYIIRHVNPGFVRESDLDIVTDHFFENLQTVINSNPEKTGTSKGEYLKELWFDLQKGGLIQKKIKIENRKSEEEIIRVLKPGLIKYFKTKLIPITLNNGTEAWTNQRGLELIKTGFYENQGNN